MIQPVRTRSFLGGTRTITVRCGRCEARVGVLFTSETTGRGTATGRTWDGVTFARTDSGSRTPEDTLTRERQDGYHSHRRYSCQRCGAPWPTDDVITDAVHNAERLNKRFIFV